jgi:DNA-binding HxlR family transcriptional regulator
VDRTHDTYEFSADCPARVGSDLLSPTWTIVVLNALRGGPLRPSELQRRIGGISRKVLTESLRRLERQHLVTRSVAPSGAPRVDYSLTPLGSSLLHPLDALAEWVATNSDEIALIDADDETAQTSSGRPHR